MSGSSKTVVIGLNWVGDNVLALPTYRALHHRFRQEGGISVAAPEHIASLLAATGIFRKVIAWNGDTRERIRLLKQGRFNRAVILPNSFRAAMIAFAAGIGERWGYSTDARSLLLTHRVSRDPDRGHQLDDYTPLLAAMNAPRVVDEIPTMIIPQAVREKVRRMLRVSGVRLDQPLFGLHPGGLYGRAKHWGDARYGELANRLRGAGYSVVLLTSPGERAHRPDFGAGLRRMVFAPNDPATASLLKTTIFQNLTNWLGAIISVNDVSVSSTDSTLNVTVAYVVQARGTQQVLNLEVPT